MLYWIETGLMAFIADAAIIGIVILWCRMTGTRLPEWVRPARFRDWINKWIDPNSRRLERLFPIAAMVR